MNTRPREIMPTDIAGALSSRGLRKAYDARPPYQRNDYLRWIRTAKREATKAKRMDQMLAELGDGTR